MSILGTNALVVLACISAAAVGWCISQWLLLRRQYDKRHKAVLSAGDMSQVQPLSRFASSSLSARVLVYLVGLEQRLMYKTTYSLIPVHSRYAAGSAWFESRVRRAGLKDTVSDVGFREAQIRIGLACAALGGVVGYALSFELAFLFGIGGFVFGVALVPWALTQEIQARVDGLEHELPEMAEVTALGLRSGLTFDKSLELFCQHFATPFSQACASALQQWSLGLTTREEALRALASTYDSAQFNRVVEMIVRSLRFGTSLTEGLSAAAAEARETYRSRREEEVAKAPVKMMIPTGTLILPAMLLLILGPILLELMEGF